MAKTYTINIYSNDGQTTLASYSLEDSFKMTIYITEKGIEQDGAKLPSILYSYGGKNIFEGVALTANNKTADYSVKSDFTVSDSNVNLYVVESSGVKAMLYTVAVDGVYVWDGLNRIPYEISSTGLLINDSQVWTYSGAETFLGLSITSGASTPDTGLAVGDSGYMESIDNYAPDKILFSVAGSSPTPSSGSLTVTYNSSDIIDTTSDGTYALPCSGKIMNSDIVIDAVDVTSLTVTYNNSNIINAASGTHTYTLSCNGKYMNSDIGIEVEFGSSVVLHEQEGSTVYLYGAYTKTQSGSVVTIT